MSMLDHSSIRFIFTDLFSLSLSPIFVPYCIYVSNILHIASRFLSLYPLMISHRLQSIPITGYYEYLSHHRQRVNVARGEESMTEPETTINSNSSTAPSDINDDNAVSVVETTVQQEKKEVTEWSSAEVQHWIEEQCQKFELKKATTEKFQLNGSIHLIDYLLIFLSPYRSSVSSPNKT